MNVQTHPSRQKQRIFITGASGCVGHYVLDELLSQTEHEIVALVRNRSNLRLNHMSNPRVCIIEADIREFAKYRDSLKGIDCAVLIAAAWGGLDAAEVNLEAANLLTSHMVSEGATRVIYFSTASVLDACGKLLPAAREFGTEYIQSKYHLVEALERYAPHMKLIGLFPTLVFGGGTASPYSHFVKLLAQAQRWISLMRMFRVPAGRFHIVHAQDIAQIVRSTIGLECKTGEAERFVLGNPAQSANDFLQEFCAHYGKSFGWGININTSFADALIRIFRIRLSPWDRYCMLNPDQSFSASVTPADFGMTPAFPNFPSMLESVDFDALRDA